MDQITQTQLRGVQMLLDYCISRDKEIFNKTLEEGPIDWGYLSYFADINGLMGMLWSMTDGLEDSRVPFRVAVNLKNWVIKHRRRWELYSEILQKMHIAKITNDTPILLKGAALKQTIYSDEPVLRNIGDVDLLFTPQDIINVEKWLEEEGFWLRGGKNGPTAFKRTSEDRLVIDLHIGDPSKTKRASNSEDIYNIFIKNTIPVNKENSHRMISYELAIVHACKHLCEHEEDFRKILLQTEFRLFWLVDIHLLLNKVNIQETIKLAKDLNWLNEFKRCMWYLQKIFNVNLPIEIKNLQLNNDLEIKEVKTPVGNFEWPWDIKTRMLLVDRDAWLSLQMGSQGKRSDWYTAKEGDKSPKL
ncbi:nucleotidyltransferase family protein [Bacillus thuringiensis]|uniref:nucleotidyltransferase family protein n=1 Tax=Bacillus thuringiensis TaxID=1428 RepID=UPI0011A0F62D|nr:nucleotidyltransferase family protein [Bacillus thuringiensis]